MLKRKYFPLILLLSITACNPKPQSAIEISINPQNKEIFVNQTEQFEAKITGTSDTRVQWSIIESNSGTISQSGLYSAPNNPGTYTIKGISLADQTKTATAKIKIKPLTTDQLVIEPSNIRLPKGWSASFKAKMNGVEISDVHWSIIQPNAGVISDQGAYDPQLAAPGTYTIRATLPDGSKFGDAQVDFAPDFPVQNLVAGGYAIFFRHAIANVGTDTQIGANWWKSCDSAVARQLSDTGRVQAQKTGGTFHHLSIRVDKVFTSEYCRAFQTASLMNVGMGLPTTTPNLTFSLYPAFNSFWNLLNTPVETGKNNVFVAHAISPDQFSTHLNEGDAAVFKPNTANTATRGEFMGYVRTEIWTDPATADN